jgi:ABC-2 type transport system permease protein
LRKEWQELKQQRGVLLGMLFLPLFFTMLPVAVVFGMRFTPPEELNDIGPLRGVIEQSPAMQGLSELELMQAIVGQPISVIFLMLPILLPSIIASYSIVGEKTGQTLEPVLATPVTTWELLVAKSLTGLIPAMVITWMYGVVFAIGMWFAAVSQRVFVAIVSPGWLLLVVLCSPLLALTAIAATVAISSRVNDPRSAQQISAVLVIPMVMLLGGQFAGLVVLSPVLALQVAVVLGLLAALALWVAIRLFDREAILTRWS